MLGLFGISLVILSVSSSVGFFSLLHVRATLIIAEVIPFLVLAVGVDNVFILVHEMDRQNLLHGTNASTASNFSATAPISPAQPRGRFDSQSNEELVDAASVPLFLSVEERVARTLAKMGPSILLSTITEVVAFALGAIVPMPAVRNFALYAAGSVFLNALLQVTVFVAALALDQRRQEVSANLLCATVTVYASGLTPINRPIVLIASRVSAYLRPSPFWTRFLLDTVSVHWPNSYGGITYLSCSNQL